MSATHTPEAEMLRTNSVPDKPAPEQQLSTNNSLPSHSTLKHLATALRGDVDPDVTLRAIMPHLERQYSRAAPKRISSTAHTADDSPEKAIKQMVPLFTLPKELTNAITELLDPADVVCLAQTCRKLHLVLDYSLPDLARFSLAWVSGKRMLGMKLRRFVFEATQRLDRDRLRELEVRRKIVSDEQGEQMLVCHVCIAYHPARYFYQIQQQLAPGRRRQCIASQLKIPICEHESDTLSSLRYWRQTLLTAVGDRTTLPNHCLGPATPSPRPSPKLPGCLGEVTLSTNSRDELVITRQITIFEFARPRALTADSIARKLAQKPALRLCEHIRVGDAAAVVRQAYDPVLILPEPMTGQRREQCRDCVTSWWFGNERQGAAGTSMQVRCFLAVRTVVGDLKDCWDLRYLRLAERDRETEDRLVVALSQRPVGALMDRKRRFEQLD